MARLTVRIGLVAILAFQLLGCGDETIDEGSQFEVTTSELYSDTSIIYFSLMGDGLRHEAIAGQGTIIGADFDKYGRITIDRVPEGRKRVYARGLNQVDSPPPSAMNPDLPPTYTYLVEQGFTLEWDEGLGTWVPGWVNVVAQNRTGAHVQTVVVGFSENPLIRFGTESIVIMGDYNFVADDPNAGSPDGSNITKGVVLFPTLTDLNCQVNVQYYDQHSSGQEPPVGLFENLPATWDDPEEVDWPQDLALNINEGQAVFYIVAEPGTSGRDVQLNVTNLDCQWSIDYPSLTGQIFVRIGGHGGFNCETS
jgi:hypothetical protein